MAQLFSETQLQACSFSDHLGVTTKLKVRVDVPRGRGLWKMNCSTLEVSDVKESIQEILEYVRQQALSERCTDKYAIWEEAKSMIQAVSIFHSRKWASSRRRRETFLEKELGRLNTSYMDGSMKSSNWIQQQHFIKEELKMLIQSKLEGYRTRGKVKWLEEGERPSRYFHHLIKARQTQSAMVRVKCADGSIVSDTNGILHEARSFYQDLYGKGDVEEVHQDEILQHVQNSLSLSQQEELDSPISPLEVLSVIQDSSYHSSPGKDGILYEFYKAFREEIAPVLVQIYNELLQGKTFKSSALESVVILIFKKKGNEEELKNWHPISLLNCDLKILTKILAKRLQKHIALIVQVDQSGFVSGHLIQDNCMILAQILERNRISPIAGGLYFLDQEKAYDRVDWSYLMKCLGKFGFGPRWKHLIGAIYGKL